MVEKPQHASKSYAIGIVVSSQIVSIPEQYVTLQEAVAMVRNYNRLDSDRKAVILEAPAVGPCFSFSKRGLL